jgi:hypothetical protein
LAACFAAVRYVLRQGGLTLTILNDQLINVKVQ